MTNTKPTLRSNYEELSALVSLALENGIITSEKANDYTAFINGRIEQLAKKNASDRKPTKNQVANDGLREKILDGMEIGKAYTASEIQKALGVEQYTLPKVTALLRPMLTVTAKKETNPDGVIERFMEKGVAYFRKLDIDFSEYED